jgi:AcrR family transcriptional regulator
MNFLQCSIECAPSRADARRTKLLEIATKLFSEHGFHGVGMAQLATASGIKVGQIYRDFASKEDIIAAITEEGCAEFLDTERLYVAVGSDDFAGVRDWIMHFIDIDQPIDDYRIMPEIMAESARNERIATVMRTLHQRVRATLVSALCSLVSGAHRTPECEAVADVIMTLGMGLNHRRIADPDRDLHPLADHIRRIVGREIDALQAA